MRKSADAFRTISEVSAWLDAPTHVLRFWESKFPQVKPVKRAGGRRYYRPEDMLLLGGIKQLLHNDGITIKGVQKILKEQGVKHVSSLSPEIGDGGKKPRVKKPAAEKPAPEKPTDTPTKAPVETQAETQADAPSEAPIETQAQTSTETPLEPLQLTPSDASDAPSPFTPDTRVNQGTYASEDTPWAKPVDPSAPHPAQAASEPAAPADPAPTGEYVRRFGFVADGADTAQDDTPIEAPTEAELGHLRPGPVAHLRYRNRDGAPIYPHRSYAPATLAAIQSVSDKLRSLGQSF